jgi:DNA-directed RNA polymerase specialized sigma24 family protein
MESGEFSKLLAALARGESGAVAELDQQYRPYLCQLIRRWLEASPVGRIADSTDICQVVVCKLLTSLAEGRYQDLRNHGELKRLLSHMAKNAFRDLWRQERRRLGDEGFGQDKSPQAVPEQLMDSGSSPSQHASREELEKLFCSRLSAQARQIRGWREAGWDWPAIGAALQQASNTVRIRYHRECERVAQSLGLHDMG